MKPYARRRALTTDRDARRHASRNDVDGDAGVDVKYGITHGLTADFTYNTDFAQVEDDEQQVNLTRFSLFFPEKREFFLEGQGIFAFGGVERAARRAAHARRTRRSSSSAGRSGCASGRRCRSSAGGRLTGRPAATASALLNIQTDDEPDVGAASTNFSRRAAEARHPAPQLRRRDRHRPIAGALDRRRGPIAVFGVDTGLSFFDNLTI